MARWNCTSITVAVLPPPNIRAAIYHTRVPVVVLYHRGTFSSYTSTMSQVSSSATSSTNLETSFKAALTAYEKQTKQDITSHPLLAQLQSCDSPSAILVVLRAQVQLIDTQNADDKLTKWLDPTVNVLYALSATLGNGIGLVSYETPNCSRPAF